MLGGEALNQIQRPVPERSLDSLAELSCPSLGWGGLGGSRGADWGCVRAGGSVSPGEVGSKERGSDRGLRLR